jgi:hypothetical protein
LFSLGGRSTLMSTIIKICYWCSTPFHVSKETSSWLSVIHIYDKVKLQCCWKGTSLINKVQHLLFNNIKFTINFKVSCI